MRRAAVFVALLLLGLGLGLRHRLAWRLGLAPAHEVHGSVVFVVLDTVRADRVSLCGYGRRTTPVLAALAARGSHSCRAYAPGTWTLPSHASFFTGRPVLEHGAHELPRPDAAVAPFTEVPVAPLDARLPTLAERMGERGYTSVLVSQNPVVGEATGLARGFSHVRSSTSWHAWRADTWPDVLEAELRRGFGGDGGKLFLFLNLTGAHGPWWKAGPGEPFGGTDFFYDAAHPQNAWRRWYGGDLGADERKRFSRRLGNAYDLGVWRADQALGQALDRLARLGLCGEDCRVVVTSDHGEMLGEHDAIDHGFVPWEGNQRVPLVVTGAKIDFPEPISAIAAHDLVLEGSLGPARPVTAVYWPHAARYRHSGGRAYGHRGLMAWIDQQKWTWTDGRWARYDLGADPGELEPEAAAPPAELEALAREVAAVPGSVGDATVDELLRAVGYVE